jgi:flagellar biosynthesis/type III secretory pathway protein FliH
MKRDQALEMILEKIVAAWNDVDEEVRKEGYEEGHEDGYNEGWEEGCEYGKDVMTRGLEDG